MRLFRRKAIIYSSCSEIPIRNFFELMKDSDPKWLIKRKGFFEENCFEIIENLFDEYIRLTKDEKVIESLKTRSYINSLTVKTKMCSYALGRISNTGYSDELVEILKGWRIKIDVKNDKTDEVEKGLQVLRSIKDIIDKKQKELVANVSDEIVSLEKQAVKIAKALDLRHAIDINLTTASQWAGYQELIKEQSNE